MSFSKGAVLFLGAVGLAACGGFDPEALPDEPASATNGIVFGITQKADPTTGKSITLAGHDYLFLDGAPTRSGSWAANRQEWPDGWCRRFATSQERAKGRDERGRARFAGGRLGNGDLVLENGADTTFEGAAFEGDRPLHFGVESGFGVPPFDGVELPPPHAALRMTVPAEDRGVLAIDGGQDVRVEWSSGTDPNAKVMVAFDTDDGRDHVRCFVRETDGAVVVKASHFRDLGPGKLTLASHRNVVVTPGEGWLVEVVASIVIGERRYVVR